MGIELDVLVGHPEHDLLFLATQVARAVGLMNPSQSATRGAVSFKRTGTLTLGSIQGIETIDLPFNTQLKAWLFTEASVYAMLLRGNAPQSEPFRRWVTEEVLPTIRKTGSYDASKSDHPVAQGVMDELKALLCRFWKVSKVLVLPISSSSEVWLA